MPDQQQDEVTAWARDVVRRRVPACRYVRLAARRHLDDLKQGHKRGLLWQPRAAQHRIGFYPRLPAPLEGRVGAAAGRTQWLAEVRDRLGVRLEARRWHAAFPLRLRGGATKERKIDTACRRRPRHAAVRRRVRSRNLRGGDETRSGAHHLRRGQADGERQPRAAALRQPFQAEPERRPHRLEVRAAQLATNARSTGSILTAC